MALKIRAIRKEDIDKLREIHERDYPNLDFPLDFFLIHSFIIEDENKEIIMGGGVLPLAEGLLITDKTKSRIKIGKALVEAQRSMMLACGRFGIREMFALTDDSEYASHLVQHGFEPRTEREVLSLRIYGKEKDTST